MLKQRTCRLDITLSKCDVAERTILYGGWRSEVSLYLQVGFERRARG
jgi:hypothetical protein